MTDKYNGNEILNQQAEEFQIDNVRGCGDSKEPANDNVTPEQFETSQGGKTEHGADLFLTEWSEISEKILKNIKPTTFIELLGAYGANPNEYYTNDGSLKISEDIKCSLAVRYGIESAEASGYLLRGLPCKEIELLPYLFTGRYWQAIKPRELTKFFREVLPLLGFDKVKSTLPRITSHLTNSFNSIAGDLPQRDKSRRRLNLANGTLEVINGKVSFNDEFDPADGFIYCLPYEYNPQATSSLFINKYLNRVLPDQESQLVLQEAMGLAFINENVQKIPYLLGGGSNGKSVLNDIMLGVFGGNMKRITLRSLMGDKSERNLANLEGMFLNYPAENEDTKPNEFRPELFRALADRNTLTVQKLYADLYDIEHYAYSVFNVNNLPKNPEISHAFFRRVLPIAFDYANKLGYPTTDFIRYALQDEANSFLHSQGLHADVHLQLASC